MKCACFQSARVDLRKATPSSCRFAVSITWASACVAQASRGLEPSASRPKCLCALEVAGLLEPEGVKPEDEARERIVAIPGWQAPARRSREWRPTGRGRNKRPAPGAGRARRWDDRRGLSPSPGSPARSRLGPRPCGGEMAPLALRGAARIAASAAQSALTTSGWSPRKPPII